MTCLECWRGQHGLRSDLGADEMMTDWSATILFSLIWWGALFETFRMWNLLIFFSSIVWTSLLSVWTKGRTRSLDNNNKQIPEPRTKTWIGWFSSKVIPMKYDDSRVFECLLLRRWVVDFWWQTVKQELKPSKWDKVSDCSAISVDGQRRYHQCHWPWIWFN